MVENWPGKPKDPVQYPAKEERNLRPGRVAADASLLTSFLAWLLGRLGPLRSSDRSLRVKTSTFHEHSGLGAVLPLRPTLSRVNPFPVMPPPPGETPWCFLPDVRQDPCGSILSHASIQRWMVLS